MDRIITDRAGFPLLWVEETDTYLHWLPVSKVQFEYFLCAATDSRLDDKWYEQILGLNPRITPAGIRVRNYWKSFLTGVLPDEARRFSRWCGEEYEIPSLEDWFATYKVLRGKEPLDIRWKEELPNLKPRALRIIENVEKASISLAKSARRSRSLADQMLMRYGVMEWVELQGGRQSWGGMGELVNDFAGLLFHPDNGQPALPRNPEVERVQYFGFRLMRRPE